jgi:GNAT superfamily N-acetyltransferase
MNESIEIREIRNTDAVEIAQLTKELGSFINVDQVDEQLESILADKSHFAYVAVTDGRLVGYIHCFVALRMTTTPFLEIGGLVVKKEYRSLGIGKLLVNSMLQSNDEIDKVRVRCNVKREAAHEFYAHLNFEEKKEQKVFEWKVV